MQLRLLSFAAIVVTAWRLAGAQAKPEFQFRFTEKPGPYGVGLKVIEQYDTSRAFETAGEGPAAAATEGHRPLQILVWYPARKSSDKPMTFGDYAALIKTETSFGKPVEGGKSQAFVEQYMHGITALPATAILSAAAQQGHFAVVIYAPSINAPATENIELCEYLASHGFVVMASPSMGVKSRIMTVDVAGANAEALDVSFLIDTAKTLPDVDISEVAAIGYSWGGMATLFDAARDRRIHALISLDGSFRYSPGIVQEAGDVHPDQFAIPLLVFSRAEETLESWDTMRQSGGQSAFAPNVLNVLNEWTHGDLLHIHLLAVSHIQFSSLYQRSERFRKEGLYLTPADYSLEEGAASYNWMARYTLEFLNAFLKHDAAAVLFLKRTPTENGAPKHLMAASFRAALGKQAVSSPASVK